MVHLKRITMDVAKSLSVLSIVIDDFDSVRNDSDSGDHCNGKKSSSCVPEVSLYQQKPYSRQSSDASIKKILEEAEHRKHEFCKLIDEHNEVIERLKKMEQLENNFHFKLSQQQSVST